MSKNINIEITAFDKKEKAGAILTDLSNAFDSCDHNLLIAKLNAYGFRIDL